MMKISALLQPEEFKSSAAKQDFTLIEAGSGGASRENYNKKHLDGAFYLDLNEDLAGVAEKPAAGGRHPLPEISAFENTLAKLGITPEAHLIIYDDKNGANAAARLWWMLRAVGFQKVQVLNGGLQAAEKVGIKTTSQIPLPKKKSSLKLSSYHFPTKNMAEVKKASLDKDFLIIDVRENFRYQGESEPIDLVAGHIPNAVNLPFAQNLDEDGHFKAPEVLKDMFLEILKDIDPENTILHCGSGVTACHTILAMDYAGLPIPNLYIGSWSEWSRNDLPIAKNS